MGQIHIGKGIRFQLNNQAYEIKSEIKKDVYSAFRIDFPTVQDNFTRDRLAELLQEGKLYFSEHGKNTDGELVKTYDFNDFSMLPKELQEIALYRYEVIKPLISLDVDSMNPYVTERIEQLKKLGKKASRASIYRWLKDYCSSNQDIRSLIPSYHRSGNNGNRLGTEVEMIIGQIIEKSFLVKEAKTPRTIFELVSHQINIENKKRTTTNQMKLPSESTVLRRIKELDEYEAKKARKGKKTAWQEHGQINLTKKPTYPLQRVEVDHTRLDLFVVDDESRLPIGRPTITSILDVYTGYPLGFYIGFEPPSYTAVMHALNHAIFPKTYVKTKYPEFINDWVAHGLPEALIVDNGKEFLSKHLVLACAQLQIELVHCPVKKPWYKGAVERYFRTLNQELIHQTKGTTFSNVIEKGEYDPVKNAVIGFNTLLEYVHKWVVDYYAIDFNKGVKGVPSLLWERAFEGSPGPALPASSIDWRIALMKVGRGSIQRTGIRYKYLYYQSKSFTELKHELNVRGEKNSVEFKYDPTDLSKIYVHNPFDHSYIEVLCHDQEYTKGLNEYAHKVILEKLNDEKKDVDPASLAHARNYFERKVEDEAELTLTERKKNRRIAGTGSNKVWTEEGTPITETKVVHKSKPEIKPKPEVKLAPDTKASVLPRVKKEEKVVSLFRDIDMDDWGTMNVE